MSMSLLVKPSNCHHLSLTAMAMTSSFCHHIPNQLRARSFCSFPTKPLSVSVKAFSSQSSNASSTGEFPARVGFLGLGIMGTPMAQNLIKSGCHVTVWNQTKKQM